MSNKELKSKIYFELDKIYHEVCCAGGNDFIEDAIVKIEEYLKELKDEQ